MTTTSKLKLINDFLSTNDFRFILKLKENLEEQLKQEVAKSNGNIDIYKFITGFIKKLDDTKKFRFNGLEEVNGKYYLCDGYRAFEFLEKIEGINITNNGMTFDKIFDDCKKSAINELDLKIEELKFLCEKQKTIDKKKPIILEQNDKKYGFNCEYILQVLKLLKNPKIFISDNNTAPIYIEGENNINAIVLPCRIHEDD